jgi:dimeric dUTPase (all-alpha-NTP-PPase superfamily)
MELEYLEHLFELQTKMQETNSAKRPEILEPLSEDVQARVKTAMFYWNCVTAEYTELQEGLDKQRRGFDVAENIKEEYIDMLHFVLSMMIYIGYEVPTFSLEWIFEVIRSTERLIKKMDKTGKGFSKEQKIEMIGTFWGNLSVSWGKILNTLPFKNWKTYPEEELVLFSQPNDDLIRMFLGEFFNIGHLLGMDEKQIYETYLNKWKENNERQLPGGKYEE